MTNYINNYLNYHQQLINPYDEKYKMNYFITKKQFNININILFSGYYEYFKNAYIVNVDKLLLENTINNINKIKIFYYGNSYYNNLKLIIGKYYLTRIKDYNIYIINNITIKIYYKPKLFNELITDYNIYTQGELYFTPNNYYNFINKDYLLNNNINLGKQLYKDYNKYNEITIINKLSFEEYIILLKISLFKNDDNKINLLLTSNYILNKNISNIIIKLIDLNKINSIKIFIDNIKELNKNDLHTKNNYINIYHDNNGFNLIEYSIIHNKIEIINILKDIPFDRSTYYIEKSYNTKYFEYNDDDYKDIIIPKNIKNMKIFNNKIIDYMYTKELPFDETYLYIIHHKDYIDINLLSETLSQKGASITLMKLITDEDNLLKDNKFIINAPLLLSMIKLNKENLNDDIQKEVFLNNLEYFCNNMINNVNIWNIFKNKDYIKYINYKFYVNNNYDNILHLLCRNEYKEHHDDILEYVISKNKEVINYYNIYGENCIFEENNIKIISLILTIKCNLIKNIYGDYLIHKLIKERNIKLLNIMVKCNKNSINLINDNNETPIILAAKLKYNDIINFLYDNNCNLTHLDNYNNNVYNYIILYGLKVKFNLPKDNHLNIFNKNNIDYFIQEIIK